MATTYAIDDVATSLAPFSLQWIQNVVGFDHNGAPIYSAFKNVRMQFPAGSITYAREWLNAAGSASRKLDILGENSLGFVTLSAVYLRVDQWPVLQDVNAGPFTITVLRAT